MIIDFLRSLASSKVYFSAFNSKCLAKKKLFSLLSKLDTQVSAPCLISVVTLSYFKYNICKFESADKNILDIFQQNSVKIENICNCDNKTI